MNRNEAKARIEAAEKELAAARKALEEAEKPLTWPELPDGAFFSFFEASASDLPARLRVRTHNGYRLINDCGIDNTNFGAVESNRPVTRVKLDGTPYIGDPRK